MTRDELIRSLERRVKVIAFQLKRRLPKFVSVNELINEGWLGAIHAVDRWDPEGNAALGPFAGRRILGAMIDYLRRQKVGGRAKDLSVQLCALGAAINQESDTGEFRRAEAELTLNAIRQRADMTKRESEVYELSFIREMSNDELARELGIHVSRIPVIKKNVMKRLKAAASLSRT